MTAHEAVKHAAQLLAENADSHDTMYCTLDRNRVQAIAFFIGYVWRIDENDHSEHTHEPDPPAVVRARQQTKK
jgi:hypothetical protein